MKNKLIEWMLQADIEDEISENTTEHRGYTADLMIANGVRIPVFCKDCQDWVGDESGGFCDNPDGLLVVNRPNEYCSYGKRRNKE